MKKLNPSWLFCLLVPLCGIACEALDTAVPGEQDAEVRSVSFEMPVIRSAEEEPSTRMSIVPAASTAELWWEASDTVGIFPDAGSQVYFCMTGASGGRVASFDGGGWSLRSQSQYFSYYPFVGKSSLDSGAIPVSFTGQRQEGTSSFSGIPVYMASGGVSSQNGSLHFSYTLLNTILCLKVTLPAGTYTKASLTVDDPLFVKEGHYDLSAPAIVGDHFTRTLEIALDNFVLPSSATVPVYLTSAPLDLRGKAVTVEVLADDGRRFRCLKNPTVPYAAGEQINLGCTMTCIDQPVQEWVRTPLWAAAAGIPEFRSDQIAAWADEAADPAFDPSAHQIPYLQWYDHPASPNGTCALLITGEDFDQCPDRGPIDTWCRELTSRGVQCVSLVYRTPRSQVHFSRSAWQDAQRAVRIIRYKAIAEPDLGLDANKIGIVAYSAGAYAGLLVATSSTVNAYTVNANDPYDTMAANVNWAVFHSPVYTTTLNSNNQTLVNPDRHMPNASADALFAFDANTCPMCFLQGQDDPYSPLSSTLPYRKVRQTPAWPYLMEGRYLNHVPAEVHLYPGKGHEVCGFDQGLEFMTQMGFLGTVQPAVRLMDRYGTDDARAHYVTENVWPSSAQTPNYASIPTSGSHNSDPYIEWHIPTVLKTKAIQIIFSGGAYNGSLSITDEVAPARRFLNEKGMTVVTLIYRYPRPVGLSKHTAAWQDLQRAIRVIRNRAPQLGLDPDRIGVMGSSAGGHLAVMGATSSRHPAYARIDALDDLPCNVQWGIGIFPAYLLTDDWEFFGYVYSGPGSSPDLAHLGNAWGGNIDVGQQKSILAPEFSFDLDTAPMLLIHGDDDLYAAMNSVKLSEKLRSMGVPSEVHTLATAFHDFQTSAYPGTGSFNYLDRIWEFLGPWVED